MSFVNVGTFDAGIIGGSQAPQGMAGTPVFDAAAVASGNAFLVSELEKRDPEIRKPLNNFTYPRDIVIDVGGGWADYASAMTVGYGMTGGAGDALYRPAVPTVSRWCRLRSPRVSIRHMPLRQPCV